jgi:chromosome segregation ATPase
LEDRARDRYGALDQMSSELHRLWEQGDTLDTLVEALRTGDGWLAYRAEALRDQLLELEAQTTEGASAIERVQTGLVDQDEALQRAREDLARARTLAAEWEAGVASVRAQLQQDRATLEEACAWQHQAEEKAKEAEELRTSVTEKAASLASAEQQLRQERAARQQAEDQLQEERVALFEARAALEQECLAQEEAQGQLQQECTTLEGAQATLRQRDDDVSRLNGALVQLSISHEDLRQSLEEQEATVRDLRREAEEARKALDSERKQVEGELRFRPFSFIDLVCSGSTPDLCFFVVGFQACGPPWGIRPPRPSLCRRYNSSQQEFEELRAAALEVCQDVEEGET